jgi:hypothetical protein
MDPTNCIILDLRGQFTCGPRCFQYAQVVMHFKQILLCTLSSPCVLHAQGSARQAWFVLYMIIIANTFSQLVCPGTDVVNSLDRQRNALESFLKACIGLEVNV